MNTPVPNPLPIVFSRSAIEDYEMCPRRWFLGHKFMGTGVERVSLNLDLHIGITVHGILADILNMVKAGSFNDAILKRALDVHLMEFEVEVRRRGVALEMAAGYEQDEGGQIMVQEPPIDFLVQLYRTWISSSVTAWCSLRATQLVQEYEVVEVETEEELPMANGKLLFLSRPDAILRRHSDGELFILNFKTVGNPDQKWLEGWRHDMQTLTEMLPVEARLGQKVSGVLIEGLVKGGRYVEWPRGSGLKWSNSPLIWCWVKAGAPPFPAEYASRYEWADPDTGFNRRLGKGWQRTPVWESELGAEGWLAWLHEHDQPLLEAQFVNLPPILRSEYECGSWVRQNGPRQMTIAADATAINAQLHDPDPQQVAMGWEALDVFFPQHTGNGNCIRPYRCPMYDCCWGHALADRNEQGMPAGYEQRQPNHPKEAEVLNVSQGSYRP